MSSRAAADVGVCLTCRRLLAVDAVCACPAPDVVFMRPWQAKQVLREWQPRVTGFPYRGMPKWKKRGGY